MKQTKLSVKGMSCAHCVNRVAEALRAVGGVSEADVDLHTQDALVSHGEDVTAEMLYEAVYAAGYDVE